MKLEFDFDFETVTRVLIIIVGLLTAASLAGQFSTYFLGDGHLLGFVPEFNLDREMNIPTWFSSFLFLFAAILLWRLGRMVGLEGDRIGRRRWKGLVVIFTVLSVDEVAAMHEMTVGPLRKWLHAGGVFYFSWVILGATLVAILALLYGKLVFSLPGKAKTLFIAAAVLFLAGSIGLEMIGGLYVERHGALNFTYALIANGEEFLEMTGQVVFIKGLFMLLSLNSAGDPSDPFSTS